MQGRYGNTNQSRFHYRQLYRRRDPFRWETPAGEHSPLKGLFLEGGATIVRGPDGTEFITHSGPWAGGCGSRGCTGADARASVLPFSQRLRERPL
jgi:hypothetical protein